MAPPIVLPRDGVYGCRVSSVSGHPVMGGNGLSKPGGNLGFRGLGFRVSMARLLWEGLGVERVCWIVEMCYRRRPFSA